MGGRLNRNGQFSSPNHRPVIHVCCFWSDCLGAVGMSKLTNKSKGTTCIRCGGHDAYSCHFNGTYQHQYGKGRGIKCHDMATAEFCYVCDQLFSEGTTSGFHSKDDRDAQFLHYIMLTNIRRFESGVIKVG